MVYKRKLESIDIVDEAITKKQKKCCNNIKISATKTRNYMLNDPLIDWLDMYGDREGFTKKSNEYLHNILHDGIKFENKIMEIIFKKFNGQVASITDNNYNNRHLSTKRAIDSGIPIIYQGFVTNSINNSFGIPDLIVRVDFLNTLMNMEIITDRALSQDSVYASSYCIIDIKHSTLNLVKKDKTIYNNIRIKPYKAQVIIYSEALAEMQNGYIPPFAYIMGKRTKIAGTFYKPFDYLGIIDLHGKDNPIVEAAYRAIRWRQELKCHGSIWNVWKPHRWEMAPNMGNQDSMWKDVKYKLGYHQGEITLLFQAGFNDRNKLWKNGTYSWRSRRFNPKQLRISTKNQKLLEQGLEVNRTNYNNFLPMRINRKITVQSFTNWYDPVLEFYIDFETANNHIFLIGMGYEMKGPDQTTGVGMQEGQWVFEYFIADTLDDKGEEHIVRQWIRRVKQLQNKREKIRFIHWTYAERNNYKNALQRYNIRDINVEWIDLYKFFLEIPISIRGSFRYGLKDIAKALHSMKYIKTTWGNDSLDGLTATILAKNIESRRNIRLIEDPLTTKIINYNEIDCKVLWEILHFVRNVM